MRKKKSQAKDEKVEYPPMVVVPRQQWGATPPVATTPLSHPIHTIIFTHTKTDQCKTPDECTKIVKDLQKTHMTELGMPDIQFNWLVGVGGRVYEGRGWYDEPTLTEEIHLPHAGKSILLAYIGTYLDKFPSDELFNTSGLILKDAFDQNMFDPECKYMTLKINKQKEVNQSKTEKISNSQSPQENITNASENTNLTEEPHLQNNYN